MTTDSNVNPLAMIGNSQTRLTRVMSADHATAETIANHIETSFVPLSVLELSQLCAVLCRRVAALEKVRDG